MVFKVAKLLAFDNVDVRAAKNAGENALRRGDRERLGSTSEAYARHGRALEKYACVKLLIDTSVIVAHFCRESAILGYATLIRSGLLGCPQYLKVVTDAIRVKPAEVNALKPMEWIEVKRRAWEKRTGPISFDKSRAVRVDRLRKLT